MIIHHLLAEMVCPHTLTLVSHFSSAHFNNHQIINHQCTTVILYMSVIKAKSPIHSIFYRCDSCCLYVAYVICNPCAACLSFTLSISLPHSSPSLYPTTLYLSLNSIQRALLAWETYVYIAKASAMDNKQYKRNSKHYTHKSSKAIETFQMSYYGYKQCCNDLQIVKVQKVK